MPQRTYSRVLLKLSGDLLTGGSGLVIDPEKNDSLAEEIYKGLGTDVELGIVIGGGNIFRARADKEKQLDRVTADQMGMLSTVINGLALQDALERRGVDTRLMTAIEINQVAEPYIRRRALRHLEKGRVVIFAAGTGNPYFTTDTAAALRAIEIKAEVLLKATKVDGIYSCDPLEDKTAKKFDTISYIEVLNKGLKGMDETAISLCMVNMLPVIVFSLQEKGNFRRIISGETIGSLIKG